MQICGWLSSGVLLTDNVDILHVSCRDLLANLLYQVQSELDIISLAWLRVNIPHNENTIRLMELLDRSSQRSFSFS